MIHAGWLGGGLTSTLPAASVHDGPQVMYYGGDLIDLGLLLVFFAHAKGTLLLAREARRLTASTEVQPAHLSRRS